MSTSPTSPNVFLYKRPTTPFSQVNPIYLAYPSSEKSPSGSSSCTSPTPSPTTGGEDQEKKKFGAMGKDAGMVKSCIFEAAPAMKGDRLMMQAWMEVAPSLLISKTKLSHLPKLETIAEESPDSVAKKDCV
ncbi:hypothetical protein ACLOJK_021784 [Asimina triloba]